MSRKLGHHKGETALMMSGSHDAVAGWQLAGVKVGVALARQQLLGVVAVGRDIEGIAGGLLEPELASPGHVLNAQEDAVERQEIVARSFGNDDVLGLLNDLRQGIHARRHRLVIDAFGEHPLALCPLDMGLDVNGRLHIAAVEPRVLAGQGIVALRAAVHNVVNVEAGVLLQRFNVNEIKYLRAVVVDVASVGMHLGMGQRVGNQSLGRVHKVLVAEIGKAARLVEVAQLGKGGQVDGHQVVVLVQVRKGHGRRLQRIAPGDAVVDEQAAHVIVRLVLLVEHVLGEVGPIHAGIRLAGNVHLPPFHAKRLDKVLPEADELLGNIVFVVDGLIALGEADADGLLEPNNVGQEMKAEGVALGLFHTLAPSNGTILLEESEQRRASRLIANSSVFAPVLFGRIDLHRR